jgi:hypothetical protein
MAMEIHHEVTTPTSNFDDEMTNNNLDTWIKMNNKTRNAKERWSKSTKHTIN